MSWTNLSRYIFGFRNIRWQRIPQCSYALREKGCVCVRVCVLVRACACVLNLFPLLSTSRSVRNEEGMSRVCLLAITPAVTLSCSN